MKDNIQLVIPMSGKGQRFVDAGYKDPKSLIIVDGKPIIEHVLNLFPGIEDVVFICDETHIKTTNMENELKRISPNCKIHSIARTDKRGPVCSINAIVEKLDPNKEIIISYCDYGTVWDFEKFLSTIHDNDYAGAIPCYTGFHPHMLGKDHYAYIKHTNNIVEQIKEKEPFTDNKMSEYASNGTYYFKSANLVKKYFQKAIDQNLIIKDEYYVSLVYNLLIEEGLKVGIFEIEKMLQWGTPYDLEIYNTWSEYFSNIKVAQREINHPTDTTLVLPMAGRGHRFTQEGFDLPKPLIDVDGKPMIVQAVDCLPKCDNKIFICLQDHLNEYNLKISLSEHYPECQVFGISHVTEGQACTCELGIDQAQLDLEKPILISACDNGVYYNSDEYKKLLDDTTNDIIVWSFRNNPTSKNNPNMYAWLKVDENNNIKHVSCKKFIYDDPLKTHAIIGTMFFRKAKYFIEGLQKNYKENIRTNNEFYVDDVLNQNIKDNLKIKVFEVKNYICWGTPDDYKTYNYWKEYFNYR
tara:strand:- start:780 stop:2348 length:1569 start_codon:yes stop_codon:yes gene_type:complete